MAILFNCIIFCCLTVSIYELSSVEGCAGSFFEIGSMTRDQDLEIGQSLILKCSLIDHKITINGNEYYVASDNLTIKFGGKYIENIEILDPLTVQYTVENATINDTGTYMCFLSVQELPHKLFVCTSKVAVGYKPLPVKNFSCISLHYRNLTCRWEKPFNPVKTNYKIFDYSFDIRDLRECPEVLNETSCQWRLETKPPYRQAEETLKFLVIGNNSLGAIRQNMSISHFKIVKPAELKELRFMNVTKNSLFVVWLPPKNMGYGGFPPGLSYWLYYRRTSDSKKEYKEIYAGNEVFSYLIKDLIPHTEYIIKLRCRSSVADSDDMWTPYISGSIRTESDVPYLAPEITISAFQVQNIQGNRTITLYWKPIPSEYENGADFGYIIQYHMHYILPHRPKRESHQIEVGNHTTGVLEDMDLNTAYYFKIYAKNKIGITFNSSHIIIPKASNILTAPYDISVLSHGQGNYTVSWKVPKEAEDSFTNYTLFWCQNLRPRPFKCEGPIQWMYTKKTMEKLQLFDRNTNYQFAVAANTDYSTSGMKWASCVVPYSGVLYKVKDVVLIPKNSTSLRVQLVLDCNAQKSVVKEFSISYCQVESEGPCIGIWQTVNFGSPIKEEYVIGSLRPYSLYKVKVLARTEDGWSEDSDPKYESTMSAAPCDPPQNVKILDVNDTTILISFQPPLLPNGKISRYSILYDEVSSHNSVKHRLDITALKQKQAYEVEIKRRIFYFTNYSIEVEACVDLACSPRSPPVYALTGIGEPGPMEPPHAIIINSTYINVTWKPPEMANGPIDKYRITLLWQEGEDKNMESEIFNISGMKHNLFINVTCPLLSNEEIIYHISIQAANLKDGVLVFGPPSEPIQTRLCFLLQDGPAYALILGLAVGGALGMGSLVIVIYTLIRWMKKEVDMIKGITVQLPTGLDSPLENPLSSYDKFKKGLQKNGDSGIASEPTYGRLHSFASDDADAKESHESGNSCFGNTSTEELIQKKKGRTDSGRNPSGDSNTFSKGHDSISSSMTNKTYLSSDSGAEVDLQPPPSPDGVFSETSSANTTPRAYKTDLEIVEENNALSSKDSGLEKEGTGEASPIMSDEKNSDLCSRFAWYVKKKNHPYCNLRIQKNMSQMQPYSKFGVTASASIPAYIPIAGQSLGLLDYSLANSEPSVADFEENNDCEPLMLTGVSPYCRYGLARSAGNGLNMTNQTVTLDQNIGYSKFGIIYRALKRKEGEDGKGIGLAYATLSLQKPSRNGFQCPYVTANQTACLSFDENKQPENLQKILRPNHFVVNPKIESGMKYISSNISDEISAAVISPDGLKFPYQTSTDEAKSQKSHLCSKGDKTPYSKFSVQSDAGKPVHKGYISFHDTLKNPSGVSKDIHQSQSLGSAYSKFGFSSDVMEDDAIESVKDPIATKNHISSNSVSSRPLDFEIDNPHSGAYSKFGYQPETSNTSPNSYITFQDAAKITSTDNHSSVNKHDHIESLPSIPSHCAESKPTIHMPDLGVVDVSKQKPSFEEICESPKYTGTRPKQQALKIKQNCRSDTLVGELDVLKTTDFSGIVHDNTQNNIPSTKTVACNEYVSQHPVEDHNVAPVNVKETLVSSNNSCNSIALKNPKLCEDGENKQDYLQQLPSANEAFHSRTVDEDAKSDSFEKSNAISNGYVTLNELTGVDVLTSKNSKSMILPSESILHSEKV